MGPGRKEGKRIDYVAHAHTFIRNLNLKCINLKKKKDLGCIKKNINVCTLKKFYFNYRIYIYIRLEF